MDGTRRGHAKWVKLEGERKISYQLTCIWKAENQGMNKNKQNKPVDSGNRIEGGGRKRH